MAPLLCDPRGVDPYGNGPRRLRLSSLLEYALPLLVGMGRSLMPGGPMGLVFGPEASGGGLRGLVRPADRGDSKPKRTRERIQPHVRFRTMRGLRHRFTKRIHRGPL